MSIENIAFLSDNQVYYTFDFTLQNCIKYYIIHETLLLKSLDIKFSKVQFDFEFDQFFYRKLDHNSTPPLYKKSFRYSFLENVRERSDTIELLKSIFFAKKYCHSELGESPCILSEGNAVILTKTLL